VGLVAVIIVGVGIIAAALLQSFANVARGPAYTMSASNPKYTFEDSSSSLHSSLGKYFMTIQVSMANSASISGSVSASDFRLNASSGQSYTTPSMRPSSFITIAAGGSQSFTLIFAAVNMNETGYQLEMSTRTAAIKASVAPPPPPPPEFDAHIDNSTKNPYDNYGLPAHSGSAFLWVNLTMTNHWHNPLSINIYYFELKLQGGAQYTSHSRLGPDAISTGGTAQITVLWEIPSTGSPNQIIFDQFFGPWGFSAF